MAILYIDAQILADFIKKYVKYVDNSVFSDTKDNVSWCDPKVFRNAPG